MQSLLECGNSIVEILGHVFHRTTANFPSGDPLPLDLPSGPAEGRLEDNVWQLLGHYLNASFIDNVTVTAIMRVLVVKNSPPPRVHPGESLHLMHPREKLQRMHAVALNT
jgi:hypothetical protein